MGWKERFERGKAALLDDASICAANREIFRQFFDFEEHKLKRSNNLSRLDEACYKTLYGYLLRFKNVNRWFGNKPWSDLTREDIQRVYDDLEDGRIVNAKGQPFEDRKSYYNKIFKSKPFRIVGKVDLARDVIEFYRQQDKPVRFVTEETFRRMVSVLSEPHQLLLFWLAFDIGENIDTLLRLTKNDFTRGSNPHTKEVEYLVNLPRAKLKRSRQTRTEPTLYPETARYADIVLKNRDEHEPVFGFGYRQALKLMHRVVRKTGGTSTPTNTPVTWKDLRSGMACHLLAAGWTFEEVNARLGHTPGSQVLNRYINYLAIDRQRPKKKLFDSSLDAVRSELEESKRREKLTAERFMRQADENRSLRSELEATRSELQQLGRIVEQLSRRIAPME